MLGIVVHGSGGPLDVLGVPADAALTPFGGSYRFLELALATLANSRVRIVGGARHAAAPGPCAVPPPHVRGGRAARIVEALRRLGAAARLAESSTVAVLSADHVLQVDLRELHAMHRDLAADVTLAALPAPFGEPEARTMLVAGRDHALAEVHRAPATGIGSLSWAGDLLVSARALPALLAAAAPDGPRDDVAVLTRLADGLRVVVQDVADACLPGVGSAHGAYWHDPTSVESYYGAQMDLCGPRPALDLFNPAWPLPAAPRALGPTKLALDEAGRAGQVLGSLVADGTLVRGAYVASSVLGHGVVVDSGAEVEDCLLMDGCHVGRGARLRRTVVTAGAVVPDGCEIGYGVTPPWAQERASGLYIADARLRLASGSESSALGA